MEKVEMIVAVILSLAMVFAQSEGSVSKPTEGLIFQDRNVTKRDIPSPPLKICQSTKQGEIFYSTKYAHQTDTMWICKDNEWIPYLLVPSFGLTESSSAHSCKQIKEKLSSSCTAPVRSGVYWVQGMKVHCDMEEIDGGGWTLVWQHSYMEDLPLSTKMTYYSDYYKPCTTKASGWCNIPNKARFGATEQVICAYHRGTLVYCYASLFNRLIDDNWRGAILSDVDLRKIVDRCTHIHCIGKNPAPENAFVVGMSFDKCSPTDYSGENCDTYRGSLTNPRDCRWENCLLPSYISGHDRNVQMTVAIYVR